MQQPLEQYAFEEVNSSALSYMPRPISSAAAYHSYHHQLAHMHQSHQQVTTTQNLRKTGTSTRLSFNNSNHNQLHHN